MVKYQQIRDPHSGGIIESVIVMDDEYHIPNDPENAHWVEYQKWLEEGNTPDPPLSPKEPS